MRRREQVKSAVSFPAEMRDARSIGGGAMINLGVAEG